MIGTTGWEKDLDSVQQHVEKAKIGLLFSPNFSFGVQIFYKIIAEAAALLASREEYDVGLIEQHHQQKRDHPSGTAKQLAAILQEKGMRNKRDLSIASLRCGTIPGTHTVLFDSAVDTITLTHQAHNREGFAAGAVLAAEWLQGKRGFFTLDDML